MSSTESATLIGLESRELTKLIKEVYRPTPAAKAAGQAAGLASIVMPETKEVDGARKDPRLYIKRGLQVLAKIIIDRKAIIDQLQEQAEARLQKNEQVYQQLSELIKTTTPKLQKQINTMIKELDSNSEKIQAAMAKLNPLLDRLAATKKELIQLLSHYHQQWDKAYQQYADKFIVEIEKIIKLSLTQTEKDEIVELAKSADELIAKRYEELGLKSLTGVIGHG